MAYEPPRTIAASAARTTTGNSGVIGGVVGANVSIAVDVTAAGGVTPTLDLKVEWSHDGVTFAGAEPADTFTQIVAAKVTIKSFSVKAPQYRLVWTIAGTTPSFTFSAREYVTG